MKKILGMILVCAMVFSLAGCHLTITQSPSASDDANAVVSQMSINGTDEIIMDSVTYRNTGNVAAAEPDEGKIESLPFITSDTSDMVTAYAVIETGKTVYCKINGEWYEFSADAQ